MTQKKRQRQDSPEPQEEGNTAPVRREPEATQPAEERGERVDTGKQIARGGKTGGEVPGATPGGPPD